MAALLANLPNTTFSASMTCHSRLIPFFVGNSVLIDTHVSSYSSSKISVYGVGGFIVKSANVVWITPRWSSGILPCLCVTMKHRSRLEKQLTRDPGFHAQSAQYRRLRPGHGQFRFFAPVRRQPLRYRLS